METTPLEKLAAEWRQEADLLRRRGAPRQADALKSAAADLEERVREWKLEALTLQQAADETGLSYSAVQKKVARGDLPNAGREGAPRVRRCHLFGDDPEPRLETDHGEPDVAAEILASQE